MYDAFSYLLMIALLGAFLVIVIYPFVVCWQKGRRGCFWLGIGGVIVPFLGIAHWIGALRLARPDSSWAKKNYDPEKMARARARFAGAS